jgi:hypothetical protein
MKNNKFNYYTSLYIFKVSADAILSSGKQIIVSLGHVGACTLKHERSEP